jgi:hypothetical protein
MLMVERRYCCSSTVPCSWLVSSQDFHRSSAGQKDIRRLDVAVDNSGAVGGLESEQYLAKNTEYLVLRQCRWSSRHTLGNPTPDMLVG